MSSRKRGGSSTSNKSSSSNNSMLYALKDFTLTFADYAGMVVGALVLMYMLKLTSTIGEVFVTVSHNVTEYNLQGPVPQTSQFEKLQQQQQQQLQQQPNLKMTTQPNSLVTRTRTSSSSFLNPSLFETNYINTYNPADTLELILEEFNDNPYTSSASSSSMVPSITEEVFLSQMESKESTFSHPSFYETNTEVKNFDLLQELNIINSSDPSIMSTYSPPPRDTSYSPSPSPSSSSSDLSYSSASAATSSFLKGTISKPRVKKNRGTPPKPVNATKEEMEKYFDIRNKNNLAASTSRKKKKEKEEENIKKLEFLKKENEQLRILLDQCKQEATSLNEELQKLIKNFKKG